MSQRKLLVGILILLGLVLQVAHLDAQSVDQKTLTTLLLTEKDFQAALGDGWVLKTSAEVTQVPPHAISAAAIFADGKGNGSNLVLAVLHAFESNPLAHDFFKTPLANEQPVDVADLLEQVQASSGEKPDEIKIAIDRDEQQKFIEFRRGAFIAILQANTPIFSNENLIKLAIKQLEDLVKNTK